jgi:signal transduction histidine kinase/CheY-like chemotaxis protein
LDRKANQIIKSHNVVIVILTVTCVGAIVESLARGWEFWVPPLILGGIIASWAMHISQYNDNRFRENIYLIFSMLVAFYHGVHATSYFDVIVISLLLLVTATLLKRPEFLTILLVEFFVIMILQTIWQVMNEPETFDSLTISRLILHLLVEICIFKALSVLQKNNCEVEQELERREAQEESDKTDLEDFLVSISHELRTPVNVINGMSTLILKKEARDDITSIMDAGLRLSHQIEEIQDYSEIQRGGAFLENEKYNITSLINDIAIHYNSMIQERDIEFIIDMDPSVPALLRGDSNKINKIIIHLLDNAFKFTKSGGVLLRITCIRREYGANLIIEVSDTGIGMSANVIEKISKGRYQANRKRNRSTGGIGLGLSIVYGFVRMMNGFVEIDSIKKKGTTVRISVVQEIIDPALCLSIDSKKFVNIALFLAADKYKNPLVREFYKTMANNLAAGLRVNLYSSTNIKDFKKLLDRGDITHVFVGSEEYYENSTFFEELADSGVIVTVSARNKFALNKGSKVVVMPKPLYGYPVVKILNGELDNVTQITGEAERRPVLDGVRALIVDDEPMNLIVASGLFRDYNMIIETAESGKEALMKYSRNDYDIIFMDHMMPEMDGVTAMKQLRIIADQTGRNVRIVALTANAVSGAKEMFLKEGFDGFISKPINIVDFERVMKRVFANSKIPVDGGAL